MLGFEFSMIPLLGKQLCKAMTRQYWPPDRNPMAGPDVTSCALWRRAAWPHLLFNKGLVFSCGMVKGLIVPFCPAPDPTDLHAKVQPVCLHSPVNLQSLFHWALAIRLWWAPNYPKLFLKKRCTWIWCTWIYVKNNVLMWTWIRGKLRAGHSCSYVLTWILTLLMYFLLSDKWWRKMPFSL